MSTYSLGDIVSLKSHPFNCESQSIISGEHLLTPPLMVVVEIINVTKSEFSEFDGQIQQEAKKSNCKCLWFSSKTNTFEEAWFYSDQLKIIKKNDGFADLKKGSTAIFKTYELEEYKLKSSKTTEIKGSQKNSRTIVNNSLSYVPPVMVIMEVRHEKKEERLFDTKTGEQKKFIPSKFVKCKWYSNTNEKFVEKFLPIETLCCIPQVDLKKFQELEYYIKKGSVIKNEGTLLQPSNFSCQSGFYYLEGYDFIKNEVVRKIFGNGFEIENPKKLYLSEAPDFALLSTGKWSLTSSLLKVIQDCKDSKNYLRIKYKSEQDVTTIRTLKNIEILENIELTDEDKKTVTYINAYCCLRNDKRYFRLDRILQAKQLNLAY